MALSYDQIDDYVSLRVDPTATPIDKANWIICYGHELTREQDVLDFIADQSSVTFDPDDPDKVSHEECMRIELCLQERNKEDSIQSYAGDSGDLMSASYEFTVNNVDLVTNKNLRDAYLAERGL